ncbi:hypothetical protein POV26_11505 [Aequorivita todarodis]|uniref:hypothetical protein n=1 Tax=Aequorivita todarodis TaxID=2036821 RepID=UPI00234FBC19|nr:hypothetical protein [Aequorivita todarodis]MDC8001666.1 hypothetical protein [Aequorivita todarodis]
MGTEELFKEIKRLPVDQRMRLIEKTLKSIRKSNFEKSMLMAAEKLGPDYEADRELTVFTELDYENFYETR